MTAYIRGLLETDKLLTGLWVRGEISNFRQAPSGHLYFTLKDSVSTIRAVMFRSRARALPFLPQNGMCVRVRGYVSVFDRDGTYQLYAEEMEPDGAGALHQALVQLKERLAREGLFDPAKKKPLPRYPLRVGIVTSPAGAAVRDFLRVLRRRWPLAEVVVSPANVQGDAAAGEIVDALYRLNSLPGLEVIVVGRGGGSLEELQAFNSEEVARAIYALRVPTVAAVGHETDWTLADYVADLRAPTPSAAAELITPDQIQVADFISRMAERMSKSALMRIERMQDRLDGLCSRRALRDGAGLICGRRLEVQDHLQARLNSAVLLIWKKFSSQVEVQDGRLSNLSPLSCLARGYSICVLDRTGEVLRNPDHLEAGEKLRVWLHQGSVLCTVDHIDDQHLENIYRKGEKESVGNFD